MNKSYDNITCAAAEQTLRRARIHIFCAVLYLFRALVLFRRRAVHADDLRDAGEERVLAVPRQSRNGNDVIRAQSEGVRHGAHTLFRLHFRELVALGRNDGEGHGVIDEERDHLHIVRRRVAADIGEQKDVRHVLFAGEKFFERFPPLRLFLFGDGGIAVPREIGEPELAEIEVVDKARPARGGARFGEAFLPRQEVDERRFSRIGLAAHRDHGFLGAQELLRARRARQKFRVFNLHNSSP